MKKRASYFTRVCVIAIFSFTLAVNFVSAQTKKEIDPQTRQKTFDVVWKTVNGKFYDPKFGGVDWANVRERYQLQVANVKTDDEFYELLEKMLKELRVSHLGI